MNEITTVDASGDRPIPRLPPLAMGPSMVGPLGWMPVATAVLFLAALGSCDSDPVVEPEPSLEIVPDSMTLTHIGHQFTFSVRGGAAVQWSSGDLAVFTVNANGTVTARGNGEARVQAWTPQSSDHALVRVRQVAAVLEPFGDGQRAGLGLSLIEPVGVRVRDAGGVLVSGVAVRFEPGAGHGSIETGEVSSDEEGLAVARWTLGPESGPQTLAVSVEGTASVTITATALDPDDAVASFEVLSGQDQWAWNGRTLAEPIVVRALDEAGRPIPDATIRFEPDAGGRADPETAVSDSAGVAWTAWTLGTVPGPQTLAVSTGGDASAEVVATARDPDDAVASVEVVSGDEQWAVARHVLPDSVTVHVSDETGRPIWGAAVTFEPEAGSGHANPGAAETDSLGRASAVWTLGNQLGVQRLAASAGGLAVGFGATAVSAEGACSRTPAVSAEIARRAGVGNCSEVTEGALGEIFNLDLTDKNIKQLRNGDFAGMPRLVGLDLDGNQLTELPEHVFAGLDSLTVLLLLDNQIEELPPGLFQGLTSLSTLWLGFNKLTELPPRIFDSLGNLRSLALNSNRLTTLPPGVFEDLTSLGWLNLEENALERLPPDLFAGTPVLHRIDLSRNRLSGLPPGLFSEASAVQRLYLQRNRLSALPPDIFDEMPELFKLVLDRNFLEELPPGIFDGTPKMAELSLIWNSLEELPRGVFAGLSELKYVNVSGNPGAPFPVRPEFVRTDVDDPLAPGPARVEMRVPLGVPLALDIPVSVQRGTSSQDVVSLLSGDTVSAPFVVSGTSAGEAVHVGLGQPPEVTGVGYGGLELVRGEELVLFKASDNQSPFAHSRVRAHRMQAGGPSAQVRIGDYFDDPDGDSLAYGVATTVPGVVDVRIEDGVLWLEPGSVDTTEVEVTATDPGGLRATQRFRTWVVPAPDPDAFNIELYFEPGFTPEEEATIRRAADRWMEAVTGDLPDVPVQGSLGEYCHASWGPRLVGVVDDVLIRMKLFASTDFGGFATMCGEREESGLEFVATNGFSEYYIRNFEGYLYEVALHEIGHVLGIGSFGTLESIPDWETDPHFPGPLAVAAFDAAGGEAYSGGKVPLQGPEGPGAYVHWRQSVIPDDIMVPGGGSLVTAITLQALADLGHEVDLSKADPYMLPANAQGDVAAAAAVSEGADAALLADDVVEGPVVVVDGDGKVVRVIRR